MINKKWIPAIITGIIFAYNPPWPIWGINTYVGVVLVLLLLFCVKNEKQSNITVSQIFITILLVLCFVIKQISTGISLSYIFYICIFPYCYCFLSKEASQKTVQLVTNILALIICISLPAWLIHHNVFQLPIYNYIDISGIKGDDTIMINHILFVENSSAHHFINRFYSVFDEPGVVGTLSAFILFANKYNFKKKQNIIILLGGLFTYSLAFYVLTIVGYIYTLIRNNLNSFKTLFISLALLTIFTTYISSTETFYYAITSRFERGVNESLDSRTATETTQFYDKTFGSFDWFFGFGQSTITRYNLNTGASYKGFILREGFISLIVLIIAYWTINKRHNKNIIMLFLLFWASFLQRPNAMSAGFILMYAVIAKFLESDSDSRKIS